MEALTAPARAIPEILAHTVRHEKLGVLGPAITPLGKTYLLFAEWFAVGCAGVVFVRRAVANVALDDDQRRHILSPAKNRDRLRQPLLIVNIADALHVPTVGKETRRDIVAESQIGVTFDSHAIAVVEPAKIAKHLMASERSRFVRYALHHVTVTANDVNVIVENWEIRPVEVLG